MEKDRDYIALSQIERGMQNEISTFSSSNTRLLEYIQSMSSSKTKINGTLKAMSCLAHIDQKQKNQRSADCVYAWMNALIQAKQQPVLAMLFHSVDFTENIQEEFKPIQNRQTTRLDRERSRLAWFVILGLALLLGAWMVVSVFVLHVDFFWMLILCLFLYALILAYYFWWWDRKHYIYRLKQLTDAMSIDSKRFVRSLDVQNLYWRPDWNSIRQMMKVKMYPEHLERIKDQTDETMLLQDRFEQFEMKTEQKVESSLDDAKPTTLEIKPISQEKSDLESSAIVHQKTNTKRKAAPNRKKTGHAARPVIRLTGKDAIDLFDLDNKVTRQVYKDVRSMNTFIDNTDHQSEE